MWQRNTRDAGHGELSDSGSDFLTSEEERGLTQKAFWPKVAIAIAFIVVLLLFVYLGN